MKLDRDSNRFQWWIGLSAIATVSACLILPVSAESNNESQQLFEPSSVLTSPVRSGGNLADTLAKNAEFKTLVSALQVAGLTELLEKIDNNYTILAPTNQAFHQNAAAYAKLLRAQNKEQLVRVLKYHLVPGSIKPEHVNQGEIKTLAGSTIKIQVTPDGVLLNEKVKGILPSIEASNGVVVRINNLLLPPDLQP